MDPGQYRADLHVHSMYSNRPSMWALRRFNCPESFTAPATIYETAKKRGMDYVTITDHNSISGAMEMAHLPGAFLGAELTSYFPEDGCKIHVVALGFAAGQFPDLLALRKNVHELVVYLRRHQIVHFQAHPLYDMDGRLSLEVVERCLLLFNCFEGLNGARDERSNLTLQGIVHSLTPETLERLAAKHGLEPIGEKAWMKSLVGGSDDHGGLYVAQTFTSVPGGDTVEGFLRGIALRGCVPGGEHGTPLTLAHSIYAIAYHFFSRQLAGRQMKDYPFLGALLSQMFGGGQGLSRTAKLKLAISKALPEIYPGGNRSRRLEEVLDREIRRLLNDESFREQLSAANMNRRIFVAAGHLVNRLLYTYTKDLMAKKTDGGVMDLINSFSAIGFVHLVTTPYYIGHHSQSKNKAFLAELRSSFGIADGPAGREKVALFTDTVHDVNGVAMTIRRLQQAAAAHDTDLTIIGCSHQRTGLSEGCMNFQAIGDFSIPEYADMRLHFPPVLDVLEYVAEHEFTRVHVSTPGLQGLLGLFIARLTHLPVSGTYHTDIPQYVGRLTADQTCEERAWDYIIWFYSQLDEILVPSSATRDRLLRRGLSPQNMRPLPRWVDTERFSPEHGNPDLKRRLGIGEGVTLLYAGRLSREKNLQVLVDSFTMLANGGCRVRLVVAGDGPYRREMEEGLRGRNAVFTGFLPQERLAELYASADVFVFPSTTDTFGNVVLEAQASGLPVVVTDQGGPQELLLPGISGLIVPGDDAQALAEAMRFLIDHPEIRETMGRAARDFAVAGEIAANEQFSTFFRASEAPSDTVDRHRASFAGGAHPLAARQQAG